MAAMMPALAPNSWSQTQNSALAMNDPDQFAWNLFVTLNRPVKPGSIRVIWEHWIEQQEVFSNACKAPIWPTEYHPGTARSSALVKLINRQSHGSSTFNSSDAEQVRINRVAFDYMLANDLWYSEGVLAQAVSPGINFPRKSIIVKANWTPITEADKHRYLWQNLHNFGLVGLNGFHIISKELPNWFWSTFEHIDNPGRCDAIGCKDSFGSTPHYIAPHLKPDLQYPPGELSPQLHALFNKNGLDARWKHYRLKGTMNRFTDAMGRPNLLGNSALEPNFEATSSCMTCHARATVSNNTVGLGVSLGVGKSITPFQGYVGAPDPTWFFQTQSAPPARSAPIVYPVDFLWELAQLPVSRADCPDESN